MHGSFVLKRAAPSAQRVVSAPARQAARRVTRSSSDRTAVDLRHRARVRFYAPSKFEALSSPSWPALRQTLAATSFINGKDSQS